MPQVYYLFSGSVEATNSDPYLAVSTVACLFEDESMGVWFTKCKQPVRDLPVASND